MSVFTSAVICRSAKMMLAAARRRARGAAVIYVDSSALIDPDRERNCGAERLAERAT
ncbi:MAG: hypothetical protein M3460_25095 [Actinomycetota bacterium]|nr:hypothetical protein [Actinomycetota bacterium]